MSGKSFRKYDAIPSYRLNPCITSASSKFTICTARLRHNQSRNISRKGAKAAKEKNPNLALLAFHSASLRTCLAREAKRLETFLACIGIHKSVIAHPALRWLVVLLWMGGIFALSDIPSLSSPFEPLYDLILRKFAHIAEYAILTALLFWALRPRLTCRAHGLLMAAVIALSYALSDEWHQTFVPGREGSLRDVGIDALGIISFSLWFARSHTPGASSAPAPEVRPNQKSNISRKGAKTAK